MNQLIKINLIIILVIFFTNVNGQNIFHNKRNLSKIIDTLISENKNTNSTNKHKDQLFRLYSQYDDSLFYKKDTIRFYTSRNFFNKLYYKDKTVMTWDFLDHHNFLKGGRYRHTAMGWTVAKELKFRTIFKFKSVRPKFKFKKNKNKSELVIRNHFTPNENYIIYKIERQETGYTFEIIRIK